MTTLVLALAGLTAGSGAADGAADAALTVDLAGHWRMTIEDERGTDELEWSDGRVWRERSGLAYPQGTLHVFPDGCGRVRALWQGWGLDWAGRDAMTPILWSAAFRGTYGVQGDCVVLRLGPAMRPPSITPIGSPARITLRPVRPAPVRLGNPDGH